jgi:hypothetical protein
MHFATRWQEGVRHTWPAGLEPNEQMGDAVYGAISRLAPQDEPQRAGSQPDRWHSEASFTCAGRA